MWPKFPDIRLTVEDNPRKNHNQETDLPGFKCELRGSNATNCTKQCFIYIECFAI